MKTKILIVGDTHISSFKDLPKKILQYIKESDWIIHVGDYTSKNIVDGFNQLKTNYFKGVCGNSDPLVEDIEKVVGFLQKIVNEDENNDLDN